MTTNTLYGYHIDEIDEVAQDLLQILSDLDVPVTLGVLALSRAISAIGSEQELDEAARVIDQFRDVPFDRYIDEDMVIEDDN